MWTSVANLKESLNKLALDVHHDDDFEYDDDGDRHLSSIYTSPQRHQQPDLFQNHHPRSHRRVISRNFNGSAAPQSPIANGIGTPEHRQIEQVDQYVAEIKRLRESEAEIKALSVNYAALLKDKEDQVSRLSEENDLLKQNLLAANSSKNIPKVSADVSPGHHNKGSIKIRPSGSSLSNGNIAKHDLLSNGTISANVKDLSDSLEDKSKFLAMMQEAHEAQVKQMELELDNERDKLANLQKKLQEEQKLNGSFRQELSSLKDENNKMSIELRKTQDGLNQKQLEVSRLQEELQTRKQEKSNAAEEKLKNIIDALRDENRSIKKEKEEFEASLKGIQSSQVCKEVPDSNKQRNGMNEASERTAEMQKSLNKLEKDLKEMRQERDKALHELKRLKQHLLEKESEESEKMDEDSKIIEELRETNEHQRYQISRLESALRQAIGAQEEMKMSNHSELKKAKETIDEINRKLTGCMTTIDAKNTEILNLQTALGQYYAEVEAKERLAEELSVAREELSTLSKQLKEAEQQAEASKREKEEILLNLSQAERMLSEGKSRVKKIEEDNEKLRRALEQSMTRLNRMSMDSDFLVDRRIVIKLLVTYFQRNHSKEVLDLMVRMLGFTDEDKQRIGHAQQGTGKGVVRGVLGFPGRLVGGILGGSSAEASASTAADNQSFADLWVDFLLNEAEREKRESADASNVSNPDVDHRGTAATVSNTSSPAMFPRQNQVPSLTPTRGNFMHREHSDSEFSTVPLTSETNNRGSSLPPPRY